MNSIHFDIDNPSASVICSATLLWTPYPNSDVTARKTYYSRSSRPIHIVGAIHTALRRAETEFEDVWKNVAWVDVLESPDFSADWRNGWQVVYLDQTIPFHTKLDVFALRQNLKVRRVFDKGNGQNFMSWLQEIQDCQRQHKHPQGLI
jgi:hypothetical protein